MLNKTQIEMMGGKVFNLAVAIEGRKVAVKVAAHSEKSAKEKLSAFIEGTAEGADIAAVVGFSMKDCQAIDMGAKAEIIAA